ncbi:hypothetical protein ACOJIV_18235 [Haloarcula sp. AONF1]
MTVTRDEVIRLFAGKFQNQFQYPPSLEPPIISASFEAVLQLVRAGARVVSRQEIREKMENGGHPPSNLQDQLEKLERYGAVFPIPRFGSSRSDNKWYMIDKQFVDWLEEVFERRTPPMPSDACTEAIAYQLGLPFDDDSEPDPLAAWFLGECVADYVTADVESVTAREIAKTKDGWPSDPPDGYLLSDYLQEGWADRFTEHIFHTQLNGTIKHHDRNLLEDNIEESLGTLLAAMLYDGESTFDIDATRETLFKQADNDAEAKEADGGGEPEMGPMSADEWKEKTDDELARVVAAVDEESIRASAYFGSSTR